MFSTKEKKERALGTKLFLKPHRCVSQKCAHVRRPSRPGVHGKARRRPISEYGAQLQEKQKFQWTFGLRERTVRRLFKAALRGSAVTGDTFISFLERRLDNVVYRLGFASSRSVARQHVSHGHILVNGRKLDIPSYRVKLNDVISIREASKVRKPFAELSAQLQKHDSPSWLLIDPERISGTVISLPKESDALFDVNKVVDFYSKYVK